MVKKIREIRVEGNIAYVPLTKGYVAVIDAEDVPLVDGRLWYANIKSKVGDPKIRVYARTASGRQVGARFISMHNTILHPPHGFVVDHADCDGLNNRRANLRIATKEQNAQNRRMRSDSPSCGKGVSFDGKRKKWRAKLKSNGSSIHIGYYKDASEAAAAYREASVRMHGEFSRAR